MRVETFDNAVAKRLSGVGIAVRLTREDGATAEAWGLVNRLTSAGETLEVARDLARQIAQEADTKIVLFVMDGLGGLPHPDTGFDDGAATLIDQFTPLLAGLEQRNAAFTQAVADEIAQTRAVIVGVELAVLLIVGIILLRLRTRVFDLLGDERPVAHPPGEDVVAVNREDAHLANFELDPGERHFRQKTHQMALAFADLADQQAVLVQVLGRVAAARQPGRRVHSVCPAA